jgi:hypothetical protein
MVVGCGWGEERGEGDLGGLEGSVGTSTGGSSTTVVLCEGVWLLDEACVTVGDTATSKSVPAHRTEGIKSGPIEAIGQARKDGAHADSNATQGNATGHTWRGHGPRQRRGRVVVSPNHAAAVAAVAMRESPVEALRSRSAQSGRARLYHIARWSARTGRIDADLLLGARSEASTAVCVGRASALVIDSVADWWVGRSVIGPCFESLVTANKSRLQLSGAVRMRKRDGRREGRAASAFDIASRPSAGS